MGGQYWFPSMSIPEIMGALSDWRLSVSREQLVKPSPDFVSTIYNACLDQVTDLNHRSLHEPSQNALNALDDPNPVRPHLSSPLWLIVVVQDLYALSLSHSILLHHM